MAIKKHQIQIEIMHNYLNT